MEAAFERYDDMVDDTIEIPLLGVVAAGEPYRAFVLDETLTVPASLWGGRKVFALRVRGRSMVDEGIHDGDFLIVQPAETAENGQTVVAEVDGSVTVKKLFREPNGSVRLQPANPDLLPLIVQGANVCVRGIVVGVMRKYGFGQNEAKRSHAKPRVRAVAPTVDPDSLFEPSLNVIDEQLARWEMSLAHARTDRRRRKQLVAMEELDRDLRALREWLGRTGKPSLRRALIAEANKLIQRMQRLGVVTGEATETTVH